MYILVNEKGSKKQAEMIVNKSRWKRWSRIMNLDKLIDQTLLNHIHERIKYILAMCWGFAQYRTFKQSETKLRIK